MTPNDTPRFLKLQRNGNTEYCKIDAIVWAFPAPVIGSYQVNTELWIQGPGPITFEHPPEEIYRILDQFGAAAGPEGGEHENAA